MRAYARETVVAKKFEAMMKLYLNTSRVKDFYDFRVLSRCFEFDQSLLSRIIRATFELRGAPFPIVVPYSAVGLAYVCKTFGDNG